MLTLACPILTLSCLRFECVGSFTPFILERMVNCNSIQSLLIERELRSPIRRKPQLVKFTRDLNIFSLCFAAHRGSPKLLSERHICIEDLYEHLAAHDSDEAEAIALELLQLGREHVQSFFDSKLTQRT